MFPCHNPKGMQRKLITPSLQKREFVSSKGYLCLAKITAHLTQEQSGFGFRCNHSINKYLVRAYYHQTLGWVPYGKYSSRLINMVSATMDLELSEGDRI